MMGRRCTVNQNESLECQDFVLLKGGGGEIEGLQKRIARIKVRMIMQRAAPEI